MPPRICKDMERLHINFKHFAYNIWQLVSYHKLPMRVFETYRSESRQQTLVAKGYSKTMKSKHLEGKAVDIVCYIDGKWTWDSKYLYYYNFLGGIVEEKMGNDIMWGGNFNGFYDGAHFELKE